MDLQGEMNQVQHEKGLEQIQFLIPYLNFPVKEIITNWIYELLGLAAALQFEHEIKVMNQSLISSDICCIIYVLFY